MADAVGNRGGRWLCHVRRLGRAALLTVCLALLGALQTIFALLEVAVWIRVLATGLVFAIAVVSEADKLHTKRVQEDEAKARAAETARATEREWERRVRRSLLWWPPRLLAEINPYDLGIRRSSEAGKFLPHGALLPPYVRRDVHDQASERLRGRGLLLIVGEPGSGMTRTAFEVISGDEVARVVPAPDVKDGLRTAIDELDVLARVSRRPPTLVWLDGIDRFSSEDLSPRMLRQCLDHAVGSRAVATISTIAYRT